MDKYLANLKSQFDTSLHVLERGESVMQVVIPMFHEDGDLYEVYIDTSNEAQDILKITDFGSTLMRLSYTYDVDTPNKEKILNRIIQENGAIFDEKAIIIESSKERLYYDLLKYLQVIQKVSNMKIYSKTVIKDMFFDLFEEAVTTKFLKFNPIKDYSPLPNKPEFQADFCLKAENSPAPFFLFGVNSDKTALFSTASMQHFRLEKVPFFGITVLEGTDILKTKAGRMLISSSDKMFPDLEDFSSAGDQYLLRQAGLLERV